MYTSRKSFCFILEWKIIIGLKQGAAMPSRTGCPGGAEGSVITLYTEPRPKYMLFPSVLRNINHVAV